MNKIYLTIIKSLKILKSFLLSILKYYNSLSTKKKTIDNMYINIMQSKKEEIKVLEKELKIVQYKNIQLKKEILNMKSNLNKKNNLIENLQDLVTRRVY